MTRELVDKLQEHAQRQSRQLIWLARLLTLLAGAALALSLIGMSATSTLEGSSIRAIDGNLFVARLPYSNVFLDSGGDSPNHGRRSAAQIFESGRELGPAHALHAKISDKGLGRYSHWNNTVYFSTSDNSDPRTNGRHYRIDYHIYLRPWIALLLVLAAVSISAFTFPWQQRHRTETISAAMAALTEHGLGLNQQGSDLMRLWVKRVHKHAYSASKTTIIVLGALICIPPIIALAAALFGLVLDPLTFATKIYDYIPKTIVGHAEPQYPYLVLCVAILGMLISWCSRRGDRAVEQVKFESQTRRLLLYFGLPLIFGSLLLTLASQKSGLDFAFNPNGMTIGGYIPFNDANGHWTCPIQESITAKWMGWCDRRPLAAGLRTALSLASGLDHEITQLVQAGLIALALYLALLAIVAWAGPWSAIAFVGLALVTVRAFLPTTLTEPIGFLLSCLSLSAFTLSLRRKSITLNTVGVFFLSFALFVRMGSMFTIPAMLVWTIWRFRAERRHMVLASIAALVAMGSVVLVSNVTTKLYGSAAGELGSNFSYSLAGLSLGGTWDVAEKKYKADLIKMQSEKQASKFLYKKTIENIKSDPSIFLGRLYEGEKYFIENIWSTLIYGYLRIDNYWRSYSFISSVVGITVIVGLVLLIWYRAAPLDDFVFVGLIAASILASAPFVIFDDGWRVLIVTNVYCAAFVAFCFKSPLPVPDDDAGVRQFVGAALLGLAATGLLAVLVVPGVSYRLHDDYRAALKAIPTGPEGTILINTRLGRAGFLVTPDQPPQTNVPQLTEQEFETVLQSIEHYHKLYKEELPPLPYAFLRTNPARLKSGDSTTFLLIGPEELLTRPGVYRVSFVPMKNAPENQTTLIHIVTHAEPIHIEQ